jgi:F0F1-type ATP synthase membrane subunit c/vacuolar-type H+-ATPase subunit K
VLAVPFTVIALVGTAYITNHLGDIATAVSSLVNWRGVAVEGSARWPEIAGMIIGQMLILSILLIARRNGHTEELAAR